jgi:hypothetical protein
MSMQETKAPDQGRPQEEESGGDLTATRTFIVIISVW